jgi:hypothetical protein
MEVFDETGDCYGFGEGVELELSTSSLLGSTGFSSVASFMMGGVILGEVFTVGVLGAGEADVEGLGAGVLGDFCVGVGFDFGFGAGAFSTGIFSALGRGYFLSNAIKALRGALALGYFFAICETQSRASSERPAFRPASNTAS